ncbi:MAG: efflux RND transporter periplasmic adaptor subunit [Planctomycetota bacterium]
MLPPIGFGLLVFVWVASRRKPLPRVQPEETRLTVPVVTVHYAPTELAVSGYGTAQPARVWSATPEVSGRVVEVHERLDSGSQVQAGELLIRIDNEDYQLRVRQREADVDSAEAQLAELAASRAADEESLKIDDAMLEVQRAELERRLVLQKRNAASVGEVDQARQTLLQQRQSVQLRRNSLSLYPTKIRSAEAALKTAKARLEEAKRDLERTTLRAPFSGRLSSVNLEIAQFVSAGVSVFEIQENATVEVESQFSIPRLESLLLNYSDPKVGLMDPRLLRDLNAVVEVGEGPARRVFKGKPIRFTESLDQQTRTLGVVVEVRNGGDESSGSETTASKGSLPLVPGEFCEVRLVGEPADRIVIPRASIDGDEVYVVDDESRLRRRVVVLGPTQGDTRVVIGGLNDGELLVTRFPRPAIDGQLVQPLGGE